MRWSRAGGAPAAADSPSPSATEQRLRSDAALGGLGIVYVNIDWKLTRHSSDDAERRNLEGLKRTVKSIVTEMKPARIVTGGADMMRASSLSPRLRNHNRNLG